MKTGNYDSSSTLRAKAEALLQAAEHDENNLRFADVRQLVHELQVYQIELEIQNEELGNAHARLERSKERYLDLFHHAPVGYLVLSNDGIIVEANHAFAGMIGKVAGDLVHLPFVNLISNNDQQVFRSRFRAFWNSPEDKSIQVQLKSPAHNELHVLLQGSSLDRDSAFSTDSPANRREILISVADITHRVMLERSLQSSWAFALDIIDSLPSPLCVLDDEGTIMAVNKAWRSFANENGPVTKPSAEGANYLSVCDGVVGDDAAIAQQFSRAIRAIISGENSHFGLEYPCHNATEERWFHGTATALAGRTNSGRVLVVHDNITERKHLEHERSALEARVRQLAKAESLRQLAGGMTHKFNNKLAAILGNLEMALDYLPGEGPAKTHLNSAIQAAWQATKHCSLLSTYLGQFAEDKAVYDLVQLCREGVAALQQSCPATALIDTTFPSQMTLPVKADAKQIQQILVNLVTNAWEASPTDGRTNHISIALSSVAGDEIPERHRYPIDWVSEHDNYACLSVRDAGSGIIHEQLDRIFDPFYSTKFLGRGMGLPVVLGILTNHDGAITVASSPGSSALFCVYIPLVSAGENEAVG